MDGDPVTLPAAALAYVRAEVRRPAAPVTDPLTSLTTSPMVAPTNPAFLRAAGEA